MVNYFSFPKEQLDNVYTFPMDQLSAMEKDCIPESLSVAGRTVNDSLTDSEKMGDSGLDAETVNTEQSEIVDDVQSNQKDSEQSLISEISSNVSEEKDGPELMVDCEDANNYVNKEGDSVATENSSSDVVEGNKRSVSF